MAATNSKSPTPNSLSGISDRAMPSTSHSSLLREHAEQQFAHELDELAKVDQRQRPPNWKLSPWAVSIYLLGGTLDNGFEISPTIHRQ